MKPQRIILVALLITLAWLVSLQVSAREAGSDGVYKPGQIVRAEINSVPGRVLAFDFRGLAHGLLLKETTPGHYVGEFMVLPSMCPYQGSLDIRDLKSEMLLSSKPVKFTPDGRGEIQAKFRGNDTVAFAFDDTVRVQTVAVRNGKQTLHFPEDIQVKNNLFTCKLADNSPITVSAETVDGEVLTRKLPSTAQQI